MCFYNNIHTVIVIKKNYICVLLTMTRVHYNSHINFNQVFEPIIVIFRYVYSGHVSIKDITFN